MRSSSVVFQGSQKKDFIYTKVGDFHHATATNISCGGFTSSKDLFRIVPEVYTSTHRCRGYGRDLYVFRIGMTGFTKCYLFLGDLLRLVTALKRNFI